MPPAHFSCIGITAAHTHIQLTCFCHNITNKVSIFLEFLLLNMSNSNKKMSKRVTKQPRNEKTSLKKGKKNQKISHVLR